MKSEVQSLAGLTRRLQVEVPQDVVSTALEKMYKDVQKVAKFDGFRPGKAPMAMIKASYKGKVEGDVARDIILSHYEKAVVEHGLDPLGLPHIEFDGLKEGEDLKFSATFEVRPEIALKKYTGFELKKETAIVKPEQVDNYLNSLREQHAKLVPLIELRPAQNGDVVTIDFEGQVDGAPWEGSSGKDYMLEVGTKQVVPEIDEALPGMNSGQTRKVNVTLAADYKPEALAGKTAEFSVTLKDVKKKVLPELDDEFAKTLGPFESLDALKKTIEGDMLASEENRVKKDLRNEAIKKVVESNPMEVPQSMIQEQRQAIINDVDQRMTREGMPPEQLVEYKKKWDKEFTDHAEYLVRSGLLLNAIAKKENLTATDEEIDTKVKDYAAKTGIEEARLVSFYADRNNRSRLRFDITEEKVLNYILENSTVKEA